MNHLKLFVTSLTLFLTLYAPFINQFTNHTISISSYFVAIIFQFFSILIYRPRFRFSPDCFLSSFTVAFFLFLSVFHYDSSIVIGYIAFCLSSFLFFSLNPLDMESLLGSVYYRLSLLCIIVFVISLTIRTCCQRSVQFTNKLLVRH